MKLENLVDIYPLSPMQAGMLFHSLYAPASGVYFNQLSMHLVGALDSARFQQAWQQLVDRHTILRTGFVWEDADQPLQIVYRKSNLAWDVRDWRQLDPAQQATQAEQLMAAERNRGFDLHQPPLRWTLLRLTEQRHQFIWHFHHVLFDGWSLAILLEELFRLYAQPRLQLPAPRPYRDYIAWLRQQDMAAAEAFWRKQLAGFQAPTPLVVDQRLGEHAAPSAGESTPHTPITVRRQLAASLSQQLSDFARQHHLTLNTVIQGAWALLLGRYSGNDDVLFGATVAGRPPALREVATRVGLFINTLPLRVVLPAAATVVPWLQQLQAQQVSQNDFAYASLVEIQRWSEIPAGRPLFESILVFENYPMDAAVLDQTGDLHFDTFLVVEQTNYPLMLVITPGRQLTFSISYDTSRFDEATITRLFGHLQTLLTGMVTLPTQSLAALPLLSAAERRQLLVAWSTLPDQTYVATQAAPRIADADRQAGDTDDQAPVAARGALHQLFEDQVRRTPEAVAVRFGAVQLTYAALNARANQLAHHLQELGVGCGPGAAGLVGLCIERSVELVVALLAILKAGGAYVPLDPAYPRERLAFMLEDSGVKILLTQHTLQGLLPVSPAHRLELDRLCLDAYATANPTTAVSPEDLLYVMYTSGSTGRPKGVQLPHRALSNLIQWQQQHTLLGVPARTAQFTPISFDVSCQEIFATWCTGGALVLLTEETRRDPVALLHFLHEYQIERLFLPFVALQQLADAAVNLHLPLALREIITAGEQLRITPALADLCRQTGCTLHNHYGPTESHVVTALTLAGDPAQWPLLPPIGRPLPNTPIYLLDQQQQPVPVGVPGELYIGGVCLARGYLNQPALTAAKFIANPFGPGQLYRTGDRCRWLPTATDPQTGAPHIEYLGRIDGQVKIRGFRIEPGEIESLLTQHPTVQEAVVIVREDQSAAGPGMKRLVAYIVQRNNALTRPVEAALPATLHAYNPALLRSYLQTKVPDYMIPSAFVLLDQLPLTPSGKIDRNALPMPDRAKFDRQGRYCPPRTFQERQLVQVWENVLDYSPVSITDNFFELGGHSLLAVQLIAQIQQRFAVTLPLNLLFQHPTVEALASYLEKPTTVDPWTPLVAIQPKGDKPPFFCVPGAGGNLLYLYALANHLGNDQPFYGFQSAGLDGISPPYPSVEAAATAYLAELKQVQPTGPYHLGGHSSGGLVAFAMAQQLARQGEAVALLAILDAGTPDLRAASGSKDADDIALMLILADTLSEYSGHPHTLTQAQIAPLGEEERLRLLQDALVAMQLLPPGSSNTLVRGLWQVFIASARVVYAPKDVLPLPITFLVAQEKDATDRQRMIDSWRQYGPVRVEDVPGSHATMLAEPHVTILAQKLAHLLTEATLVPA